jgi:hypothetical protein
VVKLATVRLRAAESRTNRARFNPDLQILDANGLVVYLDGDQVPGGCLEGPSSDPQSTMLIMPPGG